MLLTLKTYGNLCFEEFPQSFQNISEVGRIMKLLCGLMFVLSSNHSLLLMVH